MRESVGRSCYDLGMDLVADAKVDRSAFSVASLHDEPDEKAYWLSRTPYERLQALELMRQVIYVVTTVRNWSKTTGPPVVMDQGCSFHMVSVDLVRF